MNNFRKLLIPFAVAVACSVGHATLGATGGSVQAADDNPLQMVDLRVDQDGWVSAKEIVLLKNGQRLAYVEAGDPDGPAILLLHGYTDSSRVWSTMIPTLSRFRLIMPDQRGHGTSEAPQCCYAVSDLAYDAHLLLAQLGIERAHVVGHSLGSIVAQEMAATYADQVAGIALLASTGTAAITAESELKQFVDTLDRPLTVESDFLDGWMEAEVAPDFGRHARAEAAATPPHVWKSVLHELIGYNAARHAGRVRQPVLLVSATDDELFGQPHRTALHQAYPHAKHVLLEQAGHNFPMRMLLKTAKLIDEWIRSQTGGPER